LITQDDLLKEISQKELIELTDLNAIGELNQDVLDDAINDAISFISSFITIPDSPTALLKQIATELTIWELRKRNKLSCDSFKERLKEIESYLIKMANNKIPTKTEDSTIKVPSSSYVFKHKKKKLNTKGFI